MGEICRVRAFSMFLLAAALGQAPLQCASETPPSEKTYETPAQALYGLAQQFKAKGNEESWRTTLEYLVARYPNSRYAGMARSDLSAAKGAAGASGG
jgi:outer membrane protein assembly factor BamD (BamD/ComL family)